MKALVPVGVLLAVALALACVIGIFAFPLLGVLPLTLLLVCSVLLLVVIAVGVLVLLVWFTNEYRPNLTNLLKFGFGALIMFLAGSKAWEIVTVDLASGPVTREGECMVRDTSDWTAVAFVDEPDTWLKLEHSDVMRIADPHAPRKYRNRQPRCRHPVRARYLPATRWVLEIDPVIPGQP